MTRIKTNRIKLFRNQTSRTSPSTQNFIAWGKKNLSARNAISTTFDSASPLIFAGVLIVCSLAVGCSSEKPKSVASNTQPQPVTAPVVPTIAPAPTPAPVAAKPAHKKVTRKAPKPLTYSDKSTGVAFQYPPKDSLLLSAAATELVRSAPVSTNFIQPGGNTIAAVSLPRSAYPNSNLSSAFFNVSVHPTLTAEQCAQFSTPQPTTELSPVPISKLMIEDLELLSTETSTPSSSDEPQRRAKYFHVFQNDICYEFAIQVAANNVDASQDGVNPVDPDKVFQHLGRILASVKINPIAPVVDADSRLKVQTPVGDPSTLAQ